MSNKIATEVFSAVLKASLAKAGIAWDVRENKGFLRIQPASHEGDDRSPKVYVPLSKTGIGTVHLSGFRMTGPGLVPPPKPNGRVLQHIDFTAPPHVILEVLAEVIAHLSALPRAEEAKPGDRSAKPVATAEVDPAALADLMQRLSA